MAPGIALSGKRLVVIGVAVSGLAAAAYLAALLTHPSSALLDGYDLRVYLGGGSVARRSPADLYVWHYRDTPGIQFLYTPFAAMIFAALSFVPWRVLNDVMAVADVAAVVVCVWIAFRELGWPDRARRLGATLLVSGVVGWLEPVQRVLFLGQVELLLMVLVVWDMCQPPERRPWQGAGVGLAAAIKLVPLIFIAYLVITRRLRAAAVALAVFAVTIAGGFAMLPHASVQWWLRGNFLRAGSAVYIGFGGNQSLRATLTRFAGSAAHGQPLWIAVAAGVAVAGLATAAVLHRAGFGFEGLMTCALTGLLISPISWDHHWVWIAPGLPVLVVAGVRASGWPARLACSGAVLVLILAFVGWPSFWNAGQGHGLIWYAPATPFASGDNPNYLEYHWHGIQLLDGNLYVLIGCALLLTAVVASGRMADPGALPNCPNAPRCSLRVSLYVLHNDDDLAVRTVRDRVPDGQAVRGKNQTIRTWQRVVLGKRVGKCRDRFFEQVKNRPVGGVPERLRQSFELVPGSVRES